MMCAEVIKCSLF